MTSPHYQPSESGQTPSPAVPRCPARRHDGGDRTCTCSGAFDAPFEGRTLSSSDPEPPVGTWVRDKYGDLWARRGEDDPDEVRARNWSPREEDGSPVNADPETWTRVAGNQGPVTVEKRSLTGCLSASVILFKPSGKYYTEEWWRVPERAIGPHDMRESPDFRRIDGGAVLVDTQEPWGYPHLFPGDDPHHPACVKYGDDSGCDPCNR